MYHQILCIFMFLALSLFSSATESKAERLINCNKYEKKFPDVNIIDPPVEEKEVVKCDQCFGYFCYSKSAEYVLGYGCREDFIKTCNFSSYIQNRINEQSNQAKCNHIKNYNAIGDACLTDYCSHKKLPTCVDLKKKKEAKEPLGPKYTYADITFAQLTTPAPTTTTTTTESSSNSENDNNGNSESDNNGGSGNENQGNPGTNGSANSKMISLIFFGVFIFAYFM